LGSRLDTRLLRLENLVYQFQRVLKADARPELNSAALGSTAFDPARAESSMVDNSSRSLPRVTAVLLDRDAARHLRLHQGLEVS
jgi:hypothetical protein